MEQNERDNYFKHYFDKGWPWLNRQEWLELLALEYVLTWHYTDDMDRDDKRHKELSNKKWAIYEQHVPPPH